MNGHSAAALVFRPTLFVVSLYIFALCAPFFQANAQIALPGPVAFWMFDETGGNTAFDSSGNGHTGFLMNGATRYVGAQAGNKLLLDGVDDYMSVPDADSLDVGVGDFTIAAWIRLDAMAGKSQPIFMKQTTGAVGFALYLDINRRIALQGRDASAKARYAETGTTVLSPNTWYHVVGVGNRNEGYRLYINGVQEQTTRTNVLSNQAGSLSNATDAVVGANLSLSTYSKGRLDEVRLYKRALSAAEIAALHAGGSTPPASGQPNIIVIMTDDQDDIDSLSVMPKTRALLQSKGMTFTNSMVDFPVCCPARASFLTGQSAHNSTIIGNETATDGGYIKLLPTEGNTLPVWLKNAGYMTAFMGKYMNGYGTADVGGQTHVPPGWEKWYGLVDPTTYRFYNYTINENGTLRTYGETDADYQTDVLAEKAVSFISSESASSQPFFLWLTPVAPHVAMVTYRGNNPEPAPRHVGTLSTLSLPQPPSFNEADMFDKPLFMQEHTLVDAASAERLYRNRRESLRAVDDMVERVVSALEATGKLNNTFIIFTSDNGFFHGEHRRNNNKYLVYEESIQVPLIIRGPGIPENESRSQLVNNLDVVATIVEKAQATPGRTLDGRSLSSLFGSALPAWRTALLVQGNDQTGSNPRAFAGRYKAVRTPTSIYVAHETGEEELYDLATDPYQLQSVHAHGAYTTLKEKLRQILNTLRTCLGSTCWYTGDVAGASTGFSTTLETPTFAIQSSSDTLLTSQPTSLFSTNLRRGDSGSDVQALQQFLVNEGVYSEAIVSGFYGTLTTNAVARFQERYAAEILAPVQLREGTGFFGELTRAKANAIITAPARFDF